MPGNMIFPLVGCSTIHLPDDSAPLSRQGVVREGRLVCCFSQESPPETACQPAWPAPARLAAMPQCRKAAYLPTSPRQVDAIFSGLPPLLWGGSDPQN